MARKANYEEKIRVLEGKIGKKQQEIQTLKRKLTELKVKKAEGDYKELTEYMVANNLSATDILAKIR